MYPESQLQVSVDQKHLAEARSGILSILHTIMSSVTLLWSVLHQADNSDKPAAACAASTSNINLGSTKVRRQHVFTQRLCDIFFHITWPV